MNQCPQYRVFYNMPGESPHADDTRPFSCASDARARRDILFEIHGEIHKCWVETDGRLYGEVLTRDVGMPFRKAS